MASDNSFEKVDVTADELQRIEKALKNEEFRKLFVEYAQEISDPENRRKYEEELAELERSQGMDVKFLHPKPGYVLKTSIDGEKKAFINICKNDLIGKPHATKSSQGSGNARRAGMQWSLPYSLAQGRDDLDHAGKKCVVYDCMFHPECFDLITKDGRFQTLMNSSAMEGIEREFQVKLDRNNVKKPKMKFKGRPQATILRTPNKDGPVGEHSLDALKLQYPETYKNDVPNSSWSKSASIISGNRNMESKSKMGTGGENESEQKDGFTEPRYSIVHRGHFDMQQCTYARDSMPTTRPQELIVKVELPLLKSAASVQLDVFEKRLFLECKKPASYRLDLPLPYPVDEEKGGAKFDKSKSCLIITLAVLPPDIPQVPSSFPGESEVKPLVQEITADHDDDALRTNKCIAMETNCNDISDAVRAHNDVSEAEKKMDDQPCEEMCDETIPPSLGCHAPSKGNAEEPKNEEEDANTKCKNDDGDYSKPSFSDECPDTIASETSYSDRAPGEDAVLPSYDFYQTELDITLIIRETKIGPKSFRAEVRDEGKMIEVVFKRTKDAGDDEAAVAGADSLTMYKIFVLCEEGQSLEEIVKVDVSELNVVMVMKKKDGCGSLWPGVRIGVSLDHLKEERFLTEESLEEMLRDAAADQPREKETVPCSVTEFSADCVKAEFQVTTEVPAPGKEKRVDECESLIPALDLGSKADGTRADSDTSSPGSDPQSSPTGSSVPPGLKSALRSPRRRACKSVSFSDEVLVEMFLEGPNRSQKGGSNKKRGRRSPYFGPRRRIEKLKDNSWESFSLSDSELLHRNGGSTEEEEDQDQVGPEWNWQPDRVLMRQSSSESESGQELLTSPRSKGKKSKGSRRRRKEKARREASQTASNGEDHSDTNENLVQPVEAPQPVATREKSEELLATQMNGGEGHENKSDPNSIGESDLKNNNDSKMTNENEELPLEMQDHKTKCAFEFSNQVIYELDE